jgi:hypothetical protein
MAEQLIAHFFDPHFRPLHLADHEVVNFRHGLVEQADGTVYGFVIHLDEQTARKLIVIEFDQVFFDFANLDFELHNVRPYNNSVIANFMPEPGIFEVAVCASRGRPNANPQRFGSWAKLAKEWSALPAGPGGGAWAASQSFFRLPNKITG